MRIALAQLNYHIGNFAGNLQKMTDAIAVAREQGADLICFAELAVCGYPPRDFLEFDDFIDLAESSIRALAEQSHDIAIVVGAPSRNPVLEGKDLYNSAFFLVDGEVRHIQHKTLLPTYDVFDEYRYFEPAHSYQTVAFKGKRIALSVCEDIWNVGNHNPLYKVCPLDEMMPESPDLIINLSASPFSYQQAEARIKVIRANVQRYHIPMFYVNHVGAQTELLFDGGSVVMGPSGQVIAEMPYFQEAVQSFDLEEVMTGRGPGEQPREKIALIHDALVMGLKNYFSKLGFNKAILGLSGGIDSAVTASLAAKALGAEHVTGILMPSPFSSGHSVDDARDLAERLGMPYEIIPIAPGYETMLSVLEPYFAGRDFDVTEENLQARLRGMILMAFSNKFGPILLNTTNKSEMAVGYGTLYGDLCGGLSVLGDVYKTEVYELARYINRFEEIIPVNSIEKPPSAELRPNQKDSDSLPDYDLLDQILRLYIEGHQSPQDMIDMGMDEQLVRRVLRLVNINEFKRHQTAPVLRVSPKAFGMGRRMPIVGKYLS
ncbi:MAG: NAD+ synthase [Lewinellaceae bacterium]|nr:NAD+ synthase [Saprospiraceae bacterium]MCB9313600.1 NAD+ synthase [Lewinellaceae bacterium]HRW75757.1 NAD+ synthase [Saprospiraceae bacterium]